MKSAAAHPIPNPRPLPCEGRGASNGRESLIALYLLMMLLELPATVVDTDGQRGVRVAAFEFSFGGERLVASAGGAECGDVETVSLLTHLTVREVAGVRFQQRERLVRIAPSEGLGRGAQARQLLKQYRVGRRRFGL